MVLSFRTNSVFSPRLDNNGKESAAISVSKGGALRMEAGSYITGARECGVYVAGTFTMNGGTISGNRSEGKGLLFSTGGGVNVRRGAVFTMNGGTISGNRAYLGGGVYVGEESVFNMDGGMISGNSADKEGGGVYVDGTIYTSTEGVFIKTGGTISGTNRAVERGKLVKVDTGNKKRDKEAGPSVYLDSRVSGGKGGWEWL